MGSLYEAAGAHSPVSQPKLVIQQWSGGVETIVCSSAGQ